MCRQEELITKDVMGSGVTPSLQSTASPTRAIIDWLQLII